MSSPIDPLLTRLAALDADDFLPQLALRSFAFLAPDVVVLDLALAFDDSDRELFRVVARGVADLSILSSEAEPLELVSDHPRLRRFSEPWAEISFNGKPQSLLQLLGALWTAHDVWCGRDLPFGTFLNEPDRLAWLLAGGHGVLARGPRSFIDGLRKVLERFEIRWAILPFSHDVDGPVGDATMLRFGDNFVVARSLNVEPIHPSRGLAEKSSSKRPANEHCS